MYFEDTGRVDVPVHLLEELKQGDIVKGPAAIVDGTQTIVVVPRALAKVCSKQVLIEL